MIDQDRLKKLFVALFNDNEGERANAATALVNYMRRTGTHPTDIHLGVGSDLVLAQFQANRRLRQQVEEVHRENRFLRQNVRKGALRAFEKSAGVAFHWDEFEELCRTRLCGGTLKRGWKKAMRERFKVSEAAIKRWEQGIERIPEAVLDELRAVSAAQVVTVPKPEPKPKPRTRAVRKDKGRRGGRSAQNGQDQAAGRTATASAA